MTLLEKIIYLADYIEPTRDFGALKELRPLAFEDLDRATFGGLPWRWRTCPERGWSSIPTVCARGII